MNKKRLTLVSVTLFSAALAIVCVSVALTQQPDYNQMYIDALVGVGRPDMCTGGVRLGKPTGGNFEFSTADVASIQVTTEGKILLDGQPAFFELEPNYEVQFWLAPTQEDSHTQYVFVALCDDGRLFVRKVARWWIEYIEPPPFLKPYEWVHWWYWNTRTLLSN